MKNLIDILHVNQLKDTEIYEFFRKILKENPGLDILKEINELVCLSNKNFSGLYIIKENCLTKLKKEKIYCLARYDTNPQEARIILPEPEKIIAPSFLTTVRINGNLT
jgi:hypothetical protein